MSTRIAIVYLVTVCWALPGHAPNVQAQSVVPPANPSQSIVYWQPFAVDPSQDLRVAEAQRIFSVLLRAWDITRLEPALHVVNSSEGPWAASLADGNILLSRAAIDACFQFGHTRAPHLLAFVLAHELAHQRADDLWHLKFFRLAGTQTSSVQARLVEGLGLDQNLVNDIAKREARADHDGLVLMSSVGFDPYQIIDDKDFFTAWVESVWGGSCARSSSNQGVCRDAQNRALRTQVQLAEVAAQATLYDLGVQALVAGKHAEARQLFTTYGREYPSRAVLTSLGTSYLAEAIQAYRSLLATGRLQGVDFYYPLLLDSSPQSRPQTASAVRGSPDRKLPQRIRNLTAEANRYYDRALRLEPGHRATYLLLAVSHLLEGNPYLVRGVLQGRFIPRFGADAGAALLLAMNHALEGDNAAAEQQLAELLLTMDSLPSALPRSLLVYSTYHNAAALAEARGDRQHARALWKQLAGRSASGEGGLLFRLAVARLATPPGADKRQPRTLWLVAGARPGERLATSHFEKTAFRRGKIWVNGTPMRVYRSAAGARLVVDDTGIVRHAWQVKTDGQLPAGAVIGDTADRALKTLGIPTRHLHLLSGEYLAYDALGLAVHVVGDTIDGWFLYEPA
jgi:hypothetical protein